MATKVDNLFLPLPTQKPPLPTTTPGHDDGTRMDEDEDEDELEFFDEDEYVETDLEVDVLGIVPASEFLNTMTTNTVTIRHRGIGPKGAEAIAVVLEVTNTVITTLDLSSNWIEGGGAALGRCLQINRTLVTLDLTDNRGVGNALGDKEAMHFAEGLRQNSTLQVLDLSHNNIGDMGAIALGAGILANDSLKELNLVSLTPNKAWNQIRARGISGFLNHIKDNVTLATLSLRNNGVGDLGQAVSAYLLKSNAIISLDISRMRISDTAITAIAKGLEQNYTIKELDLSENPFGDQGASGLFKAIVSSNCLRKVGVKEVKFTKEMRMKLEDVKLEKPEIVFVE
ncbi:hypothetical protein BC829DRAFT_413153 [Chytridium lagenaria]|nr:hypothetical protein BC829DRAFT_413153 [Chytridium lagenaria]